MIDICLVLDKNLLVLSVQWENPKLEMLYTNEWQSYLQQPFPEIAQMKWDRPNKRLIWKRELFSCVELVTDDGRCLLLKKEDRKEHLYSHTLDEIQDGVQIYDQNACLVYMNKASRKISHIPSHLNIEGKHLLDLYDVEEEISTVMTTLRTGAPVINRFDNYNSTEGGNIVSVNTGYPIFDNKELIGALVFEQNLQTINTEIEKLETVKKTIIEQTRDLSISKFNGYHFSDLIGSNQELMVSVTLAKKIATQDCNILLVGETGTGKEIFAQSIHKASDRKRKKFVAINCAAVPETLIESMFFGTSKGSFTGSLERSGLLEEANGGVLFLDELNSMSLSMQSKLLRVIQEGSFRRVGGNQDIQTNVRFISSCNEDAATLIGQNILRKDLFYRLSTVTIDIPPLRNRMDDIDELVRFYLFKNINRYVKSISEISPQVLSLFQRYDWPGNIRELFNVLDYVLNTIDGDTIEIKHLPKRLQSIDEVPTTFVSQNGALSAHAQTEGQKIEALMAEQQGTDLQNILQQIERKMIEEMLIKCRYNISKSAGFLGLSRQNLQYRIKKLRILI